MPKKLKRWRMMRKGETRQPGDQYVIDGVWHPVVCSLGMLVTKAKVFRTKRQLPKFYAR